MKRLLPLIVFSLMACSSKTAVNIEEVLYLKGEQYITTDSYDTSFLGFIFNQKVYNGPGFFSYRNGEKREQGPLKNGFKSGVWTGWDKKGKKKYEGNYKFSFQVGKWTYFNNKGIKALEENYFICDEECDEKDPSLGKLIDSKEF